MSFEKIGKRIQQIAGWGTCIKCDKPLHQYNRCVGCQGPLHRTCGRYVPYGKHWGEICPDCETKSGGTCVKCKKEIEKLHGPDGKNVCSDCGKPMHRGCGSYGIGSNDKVCMDCYVELGKKVR